MSPCPNHHRIGGFTLIEIAVAMAIIAILGASVLMAVRVQTVQRQTSETRAALDEAREALLAYAAANGNLPCPATGAAPGQGKESGRNNSGVCVSVRGLLPWETLGIQAIDGWNHRLAYVVTPALTVPPIWSSPTTHFTLDTTGTIRIAPNTASADDSLLLATLGSVACAVWSFGADGFFAANPDGSIVDGSAAGADETQNGSSSATDVTVVARDISENAAAPGGSFDDHVIWISRFVLFGRLITAGKLP